jgi:hypothetical protein
VHSAFSFELWRLPQNDLWWRRGKGFEPSSGITHHDQASPTAALANGDLSTSNYSLALTLLTYIDSRVAKPIRRPLSSQHHQAGDVKNDEALLEVGRDAPNERYFVYKERISNLFTQAVESSSSFSNHYSR